MSIIPDGGFPYTNLSLTNKQAQIDALVEHIARATNGRTSPVLSGSGDYTVGAASGTENDLFTWELAPTGTITGVKDLIRPLATSEGTATLRRFKLTNNLTFALRVKRSGQTDNIGSVGPGRSRIFSHNGTDWLAETPEFDKTTGGVAVPTCVLYNSTNQSIPHLTDTPIAFDTEYADTDGMHDNATNNTRITVRTAGRYLVGALLEMAVSVGGTKRILSLRRYNSSAVQQEVFGVGLGVPSSANAARITAVAPTVASCAVGDFFQVLMDQDSGGALNSSAVLKYAPLFWAYRIGD